MCVRNLVSRPKTSSFLCFIETQSSTMVKLAKVRAEVVISRAFSAVTFNRLCCVRARGLLRKVATNRQNKIDLRLRWYGTFYNGKHVSYAVDWWCPRSVACTRDSLIATFFVTVLHVCFQGFRPANENRTIQNGIRARSRCYDGVRATH